MPETVVHNHNVQDLSRHAFVTRTNSMKTDDGLILPNSSLANVGKGLLVTQSVGNRRMIRAGFSAVTFSTDQCSNSASCLKAVGLRKFEVVFVDFALGRDAEVAVENVRASASTRTSVIVAITADAGQARRAFSTGATFVVQEPLSILGLQKVSRAAYGLILRERTRYFRCSVEAPLIAYRNGEIPWHGQVANISENGLCTTVPVPRLPGEILNIKTQLPGSAVKIVAKCEVLWSDKSNRAGLRFLGLADDVRADLQSWLRDQLEAALKTTGSLHQYPAEE